MRLLRRSGRADERRVAAERDFAPVAVADVELSAPLEAIPAVDGQGRRYGGARVLLRLHSKPLGMVELAVGEGGVSPAACAAAIWDACADKLNEHLRSDGLPEVGAIPVEGVGAVRSPPCLARREAVLAAAPTASVAVCTRDRTALLARTLRSLQALEYPHVEMIVVDSSSSSSTAELIRDEFPGVRYLHVGHNGLSVARTRSVAEASGTIVAFTDDDVAVDRFWLAELVAALQLDERVACATGVVVPLELQTPAQLWFEESGAFTQGFEWRAIDLQMARARGSLLPYATGKIGAGVSMAWRASVLRELGGFDVSLDTLTPPWPPRSAHATAGEDLAAFFDALVNGYRIVFEPGAIVYHEHRRTYEELTRQLYWHGIGLSAYLTRCLVTWPAQIPGFIRRVPRGIFYGFATASPRNRAKSRQFPSALTRAELRGVVHGPFAYLRGLPKAKRIRATERPNTMAPARRFAD